MHPKREQNLLIGLNKVKLILRLNYAQPIKRVFINVELNCVNRHVSTQLDRLIVSAFRGLGVWAYDMASTSIVIFVAILAQFGYGKISEP